MTADDGTGRRGWLRFPARLLGTALLAALALIGLAYGCQRRLLYFPSPGPVPIPPGSPIREVDLISADGVPLKAWWWPGEAPVALLVLHGNAGHRGHRIPWIAKLHETGASVFILDYRGYGGSGGSPTEEGLYRDAEAAAAWLAAAGAGRIVYVGESIGTAVAIELALRRPPAALVLQSAFTSAVDVGRRAYPLLPVGLLLRDRFDSMARIGRVGCPVLSIHGRDDSLVPIEMGRALHDRAPGPREFLEIAGADHNDPLWDMDPAYVPRLVKFLGL